MSENKIHELQTPLQEKTLRERDFKRRIEESLCEMWGLRKPPLDRLDQTSGHITHLSRAAELLVTKSLSNDEDCRPIVESIQAVYWEIEKAIRKMSDHLEELAQADGSPQ